MAELIDRSKLMFLLERELDMNGITDWGKGYMEAIHDAMEHAKYMETTTESEIRAMAIDEFAEKLKNNISPMSHGLGVHDIDRITEEMKNSCIRKTFREVDTDYIAEQLKEEQE